MTSAITGGLGAVAFALIAFGIAQFFVTIGMGFRERLVAIERDDRLAELFPEPDSLISEMYLVIPALNEERVIEGTVRAALKANAAVRVIVVDDASDDQTAAIVESIGSDRVKLIRRKHPHAQLGKGEALNQAFRWLVAHVDRARLDARKVAVCIMDADGRLSPGAVAVIQRVFADENVAGVQLPVRIRNTGTILTDYQDFEFWGLSAIQQLARGKTHTVSLGGNGQFTRLSALRQLPKEPWSSSLTEDLDLAVSLLALGWKIESTPNAWVSQQAVETLGPLIRQRTRWMQGHLLSAARLTEIRRSTLAADSVLEVTNYLMVPLLMILPWSIVFNISLATTWVTIRGLPEVEVFGMEGLGTFIVLAYVLVMSLFPHAIAGVIYRSRRPELPWSRALLLGVGFVFYNFVTFAATWKALVRIARGENEWTKTARSVEPSAA